MNHTAGPYWFWYLAHMQLLEFQLGAVGFVMWFIGIITLAIRWRDVVASLGKSATVCMFIGLGCLFFPTACHFDDIPGATASGFPWGMVLRLGLLIPAAFWLCLRLNRHVRKVK
jgi:hypothetical protein